ncbi:MAG: YfiR/HmsC family protein, partial [Bacteroidales bacterium]|nr:YfiR/HmsC family protein [Bacteroidales bacterium]
MKAQKKYLPFFILLFLFSLIIRQSNAQKISDEAQRAEWIFNISYGITWQDEANITSYTIGVFSSKAMFSELQKQAKTKKIKGKPVEVIRYLNYKDIQANHIVYVSRNENAYLGLVYQKFKGKNVLIISDRSKQPDYSIINFRKIGDSKPFDINDRLAGENNITISRQLLKIGGSREVIQRIYAETNRKLLAEKKALEEKKKEIADKEKLLSEQEARIKAQRDSIASKENLISAKEGELQDQNARLDSMSAEVLQQRKDLTKNQAFLKIQEKNIAKQKEIAKKLNIEIISKSKTLKEQEEKLRKNKEKIGKSQKNVATQKKI